jgi:hypothetical protein
MPSLLDGIRSGRNSLRTRDDSSSESQASAPSAPPPPPPPPVGQQRRGSMPVSLLSQISGGLGNLKPVQARETSLPVADVSTGGNTESSGSGSGSGSNVRLSSLLILHVLFS